MYRYAFVAAPGSVASHLSFSTRESSNPTTDVFSREWIEHVGELGTVSDSKLGIGPTSRNERTLLAGESGKPIPKPSREPLLDLGIIGRLLEIDVRRL
mmetsp:Transcript_125087/g.186859  ORF Transcript_125087/g.186859 Transcript_125087/m.186859 type:complete len:98 (-) Transcript_125087:366-659(-)